MDSYYLVIARSGGSDPVPLGVCRDPVVVRLAMARAREELRSAGAEGDPAPGPGPAPVPRADS